MASRASVEARGTGTHFLVRLERRMHQKHFQINDQVFERVKSARTAINELAIQLHRLLPPPQRFAGYWSTMPTRKRARRH
jgi:hypothetical protein